MEQPRLSNALAVGATFFAAALVVPGCVATDTIALDVRGVSLAVDYSDFAAVLEGVVCDDGNMKPEALKKLSDRLDVQLKRLAVTGPTATPGLFPRAADRLAYWYNARAAWSMKVFLLSGLPKKISTRRLEKRLFPLDGRTMTLQDIDAILLAEHDWQAVVAAPDVRLQRARLSQTVFTAESVQDQVAERFQQFLDDDVRFVIDVEHRRVLFPPVLWRLRNQLIEDHNRRCGTRSATLTTALLGWSSGSPHRRLQDAIGYPTAGAWPNRNVALCDEH